MRKSRFAESQIVVISKIVELVVLLHESRVGGVAIQHHRLPRLRMVCTPRVAHDWWYGVYRASGSTLSICSAASLTLAPPRHVALFGKR